MRSLKMRMMKSLDWIQKMRERQRAFKGKEKGKGKGQGKRGETHDVEAEEVPVEERYAGLTTARKSEAIRGTELRQKLKQKSEKKRERAETVGEKDGVKKGERIAQRQEKKREEVATQKEARERVSEGRGRMIPEIQIQAFDEPGRLWRADGNGQSGAYHTNRQCFHLTSIVIGLRDPQLLPKKGGWPPQHKLALCDGTGHSMTPPHHVPERLVKYLKERSSCSFGGLS